jgi:hypothetical protein
LFLSSLFFFSWCSIFSLVFFLLLFIFSFPKSSIFSLDVISLAWYLTRIAETFKPIWSGRIEILFWPSYDIMCSRLENVILKLNSQDFSIKHILGIIFQRNVVGFGCRKYCILLYCRAVKRNIFL